LRSFLRHSAAGVQATLILLVLFAHTAVAAPAPAPAEPPAESIESPRVERPGRSRPDTVDPRSLDGAIERVIQQREYSWRGAREKLARAADETWAARLEALLKEAVEGIGRWF